MSSPEARSLTADDGYMSCVSAVVSRLAGSNEADKLDLQQQVFFLALRDLRRPVSTLRDFLRRDDKPRVIGWLSTTARNCAFAAFRGKGRGPAITSLDGDETQAPVAAADSPRDELESRTQVVLINAILREAIELLHPHQRMAMLLHSPQWGSRPIVEIAQRMKVTVPCVKSWRSRAIESVRAHVAKRFDLEREDGKSFSETEKVVFELLDTLAGLSELPPASYSATA